MTFKTPSQSLFLKRLLLKNFRRYEETHFQFEPTINAIIGPNAFGKTTVLEAIQLLINGRSFRTQQVNDLVLYGKTGFFIEATFVKQKVEQTLKIAYDGNERKIVYNNTVFHSNADLLGLLQGVLVTPDDASLIKGSPQLRRHFLDLQIAQVDPLYVHHLTRYMKALRQRNALLKIKNLASIESWEEEMATAASYVVMKRMQTISDLEQFSNHFHLMLTGDHQPLDLVYKSSFFVKTQDSKEIKDLYLKSLNKNRMREKDLGVTLTGPHRDDLIFHLGQKEVRLFASEGQQRSCVMALKLAEWQRMHLLSTEKPLMLVDDIGISLDGTRRKKLMDYLSELGQVFMTSTDPL